MWGYCLWGLFLSYLAVAYILVHQKKTCQVMFAKGYQQLVDFGYFHFQRLPGKDIFPVLCHLVCFLLMTQIALGVVILVLLFPIWPDFKLFQIVHQGTSAMFLQIYVFSM